MNLILVCFILNRYLLKMINSFSLINLIFSFIFRGISLGSAHRRVAVVIVVLDVVVAAAGAVDLEDVVVVIGEAVVDVVVSVAVVTVVVADVVPHVVVVVSQFQVISQPVK